MAPAAFGPSFRSLTIKDGCLLLFMKSFAWLSRTTIFNVIHSFIISSTSAQAFTKKFGNAIRAATLKSSKYIIDGDVSTTYDLEDDGLGKIIEYKFADNLDINKTYLRQAGSIDYVSGRIDLVGIIGEPINGTNILDIDFSVDTTEISSGFNQILSIDANASGVRIEVRGQ